ncbi:hypothetical protein EV189_0628 [Motilibacter rhizosphaerae]|uniref:Uncharacterized protein n=1 Tax=Motilibacter rhizosphaerae TaxID=598652 RepID=A0A4Q7NW08_9ACTN|nr:hypothetical protein [Motilibacter rhizosphaerae]RZS91387.1 hypothetical protein EV189_0628 [Motilibacter rhizosphaerae]
MYSLVSAPVLGFDLVRRPGGEEVAGVLATALALGPADLPALLAAAGPEVDRVGAWANVTRVTRDQGTLRGASEQAAAAAPGAATLAALRQLATTSIGGLDDVITCVRHDVFDWTWAGTGTLAVQDEAAGRAVGVVCDAVAGTYAAAMLSTADRAVLLDPWRSVWGSRTAPTLDLGPAAGEVTALLDALRGLSPAQREALLGASDQHRASTRPWALAVHNASWAAHLSARTRPAAAAQMAAVRAVRAAGFSTPQLAGGVWNAVSGAVHAMVVGDLLADVDLDVLTAPVAGLV